MDMETEYPKTIDELEAQFWSGNQKASQIWRSLKPKLTHEGFTWPIYLKLLRTRRDLIILHENGDLSMPMLIMEISAAARSPIGDFLLRVGG